MCFGGSSDDAGAPAERVRLEQMAPSGDAGDEPRASRGPPSGKSAERPSTHRQHRPPTSATRERPAPSRRERPASAAVPRRDRPASASTRDRAGSRRGRPATAAAREQHATRPSVGADGRSAGPRTRYPSIAEQYSEDRDIISSAAYLLTLIDEHADYFYVHDDSPSPQGIPDLDNPRTRYAAICRYIARVIINSIIMADRNRPVNPRAIAQEISSYLSPFASDTNGERDVHLRELCRLGQELRRLMDAHQADWRFGAWDEVGFILMAPALLRDGEQVIDRKVFKIA